MKDLSKKIEVPPEITTREYVDSILVNSGARYVHIQSIPSTVWTVTHNLGFTPQVSVIIDDTDQTDGVFIFHSNDNEFTVTTGIPTTGKAVAD